MHNVKPKLTAVKNHVFHYRARYAVAATVTVCVVAQTQVVKEWNAFLTDHNLLDEFYLPEL